MKVKFEDFKKIVDDHLNSTGYKQAGVLNPTIEILNFEYDFNNDLKCDISGDQLTYVNDKLMTYKENIKDVNSRLRRNKFDRQCVILFDQSLPLPNCTVAIQFQIRDKRLFLSVFQRSQDIEKLEMDCKIFHRMAKEVIDYQNSIVDDTLNGNYSINVKVGNMHKYIK